MCPCCGSPLIIIEWEGIEVDYCPACGGTWLDAGELELIAERSGADLGRLRHAIRHARGHSKLSRRCPRCRRKMERIDVGEDQQKPIELDRCPRGHGLWFDRGEMDSLIDRYEEGEEGAMARFFGNLYRHERESKRKDTKMAVNLGLIGFVVIIGLLVLLIIWVIATYNGLVRLRNMVREAWAQIDVQLKRRHDLIPNLVEAVKGYAGHERSTLDEVIKARSQAVAAHGPVEQAQAEQALSGALGRLMLLVEQYPNLKANENFMALQEELTSTENKIGSRGNITTIQ